MKRSPIKKARRPGKTQKRKGRIVASSSDYRELVWRVVFGQVCACGCGRKAETLHHLVGRGGPWGGDDLIDNAVALAGDGTQLCHGAYTSRRRTLDPDTGRYIEPDDVAAGIRLYLETPENAAKRRYVVRKTSETWLDAHYPMPKEAAA